MSQFRIRFVGAAALLCAAMEAYAVEDYSTWAHSKRISINAVVAGLKGDVADIPLLVRLGKGSFNFAEAADAGRDLRFADEDGTPLAYAPAPPPI